MENELLYHQSRPDLENYRQEIIDLLTATQPNEYAVDEMDILDATMSNKDGTLLDIVFKVKEAKGHWKTYAIDFGINMVFGPFETAKEAYQALDSRDLKKGTVISPRAGNA